MLDDAERPVAVKETIFPRQTSYIALANIQMRPVLIDRLDDPGSKIDAVSSVPRFIERMHHVTDATSTLEDARSLRKILTGDRNSLPVARWISERLCSRLLPFVIPELAAGFAVKIQQAAGGWIVCFGAHDMLIA